MLSEHNPIAELIHQIQQKWTDEVSPFPELKLVRWLIKPEEARLFEGFLRLESTEHGKIPEVLVAMLSPFKDEETYPADLMNDWTKAYSEDIKTQEKLKTNGTNTWNTDGFPGASFIENGNPNQRFLEMLSGFHAVMADRSMRLVVALFPHSIHNMEGFRRWLTNLLKMEIPNEISFMIFDHVGEYHFDGIFKNHPGITKSLHIILDMDGAISKIAKMGDPNSPEVKFRECILEMGKAVQNKNLAQLHAWGEKGLQVTQRSGFKSLYASAHIVYAGMLFNFKLYNKIDVLLSQGLSLAIKGLKTEEAACRPLVIQYHGYIAASRQLQKKMPEAVLSYEKQGDTATEYQLPGMAITPYRQAYILSKKHLPERYDELLQKAYSAGNVMTIEEKVNSSFPGIAYDFMQWHESRQRWEEAKRIDNELTEISGPGWKERAKNPSAQYTLDTKKSTILT
jgi:hypothetical protein